MTKITVIVETEKYIETTTIEEVAQLQVEIGYFPPLPGRLTYLKPMLKDLELNIKPSYGAGIETVREEKTDDDRVHATDDHRVPGAPAQD